MHNAASLNLSLKQAAATAADAKSAAVGVVDSAENNGFAKRPVRVLTIDVGGSAIKYGICDCDGHISNKGQEPTPMELDSTVEDFIKTIKWIYEQVKKEGGEFEGIAMSMPGCINPDGSLRTGGALMYNYGQPIADLVEEATGMRPVIENDAKAAAAAELWIGSLRNVQMGAVLILGTGLGGAIIVNGHVIRGPNGSAGELSAFIHNCDNFSDDLTCESQIVSATGLVLRACKYLNLDYEFTSEVSGRKMPLDGRKIFEMYHDGNEVIKKVIDDFGFETGKLIFNLSVVLNLQKVAIGGGISCQDSLIDAIVRGTDKAWETNPLSHLDPPLVIKPEVTVCQFHNDANLIGAMHQYLEVHNLI